MEVNYFFLEVSLITYSDNGDKEMRVKVKCLFVKCLLNELITYIQGCTQLLFTDTSFSIRKQLRLILIDFHKMNIKCKHFVFDFNMMFVICF